MNTVGINGIMYSTGSALCVAIGCEAIMVDCKPAYEKAIIDLRYLLGQIGRTQLKAYGYAKQLRAYRARVANF